jgi:RimJ/RimL family protein N-acetyltransferase
LNREESDAMASGTQGLINEQSWGFWAVETKNDNEFIGFVGLHKPTYELPVTSCVEVGWRLRKEYWGKGYDTEAAKEALRFGF